MVGSCIDVRSMAVDVDLCVIESNRSEFEYNIPLLLSYCYATIS